MYESRIKAELATKYEEKEIQRMWNEFWGLAKVMAVIGILYATSTLKVFSLIVMMIAILVIYKINK